jgi:hypothetical protein
VGTFASSDIQFGKNTGFRWAPYDLTSFGADLTGTLEAASSTYYRIAMSSDDGSLLFIDGALVLNDGGMHAPGLVFADIVLTQGPHPFELQYFQGPCCQSGLNLDLGNGLTFGLSITDVPEPGSEWMLLAGLALSLLFLVFQKQTSPNRP